jgi:hypothetical protein
VISFGDIRQTKTEVLPSSCLPRHTCGVISHLSYSGSCVGKKAPEVLQRLRMILDAGSFGSIRGELVRVMVPLHPGHRVGGGFRGSLGPSFFFFLVPPGRDPADANREISWGFSWSVSGAVSCRLWFVVVWSLR